MQILVKSDTPQTCLVFSIGCVLKCYCTRSWINCGMAKSLVQARASSSVIWPYHNQFMNEGDNPIIIYLIPHFWDVLDTFGCYIRTDKTQEDKILAVVHCRKQSDYLVTMSIAITTDQLRAIVILAYHWLASSCTGGLWGVGNHAVHKLTARLLPMVK